MTLMELAESGEKISVKADRKMVGLSKGRKEGRVVYVSPNAYILLETGDEIMAQSIAMCMKIEECRSLPRKNSTRN